LTRHSNRELFAIAIKQPFSAQQRETRTQAEGYSSGDAAYEAYSTCGLSAILERPLRRRGDQFSIEEDLLVLPPPRARNHVK